jgi:NADP-dependent 3-hydroxy acid dehydrogenase YdfG
MKEAAVAYGMPVAALGLFRFLKQNGVKGIVLTAASSIMGKILTRLCIKEDISVIGIVRRDESIEALVK